MAGEGGETTFFGSKITIPSRDRSETRAFNFLISGTDPTLFSPDPLPVGALYFNYWGKKYHYRTVLTGVANEFYFGRRWKGFWEWVAKEENLNVPLAVGEYLNGKEVESSELYLGYIKLGTGIGINLPISPGQIENRFTLALLYQLSYHYYQKSSKTADTYKPHPDTFDHALLIRMRYDGFARNLLELRHKGIAFGADIQTAIRESTSFHGFQGQEKKLPSYFKYQAYFLGAHPLTFLSSHLVGLFSIYGGYSPNALERNTAFVIGGSSSADETETITNPILWGAHLSEFNAKWYGLATLELRWEALFFLFFHFRLTIGRLKFRSLKQDSFLFYKTKNTGAVSFGITSGFFFESVLVFDYAYNWEIQRRGHRGSHFFILRWSKSF